MNNTYKHKARKGQLGDNMKPEEKRVIIMRGLAGSGKSTYVKNNYPNAAVCSADNFFYDEEGNYNYDRFKIGEAHSQCQIEFAMLVRAGQPEIVVDNTNSQQWEYRIYEVLAKLDGYDVKIVEKSCNNENTLIRFIRRGLHGVPRKNVEDMWSRWETDDRAQFVYDT
jgi:predicted kinase